MNKNAPYLRFWERADCISLNRLAPRATLYPFASVEDAQSGNREHSCWFNLLNGGWHFQMFEHPDAVPPESLRAPTDDTAGVVLEVPGNWTLQGFGHPHYTNVKMPFPDEPPSVPKENPTGVYGRELVLPEAWANRRTIIHFGGAESVLAVYLDGQFVGMSKDSRLPSEFDLSDFVVAGQRHWLTAVVIKWSDASFIEDQDQWWMGGLFREVYWYSTDTVRIEDVFVTGNPTVDFKSGDLELKVKLRFFDRPVNDWIVEALLFDPRGKRVWKEALQMPYSTSTWSRYRLTAHLKREVAKPYLWSAESPDRYQVLILLKSPDGHLVEVTSVHFGFRSVEVRDRQLLINGRCVMIHGVNRHDHHERLGKAIDRETMLLDAVKMKQFNINAVRTSHYPNDPYFLDVCDELGLYVVDEANLEAHAYYNQLGDEPGWSGAFLDRAVGMVERDKNHPSIILWSLGNETGYGPNQDAMAGYVRGRDWTRPLFYEPGIFRQGLPMDQQDSTELYNSGERVTDVICPMYASIDQLVDWATDPNHTDRRRPCILSEYSHAMGNSNGGLSDYYEQFMRYDGLQGGFVWEWIDHGLRHKREDGTEFWAYGGDFGDKPHDANFVCDGLVWPDRSPHPALFELKKLAQPIAVSRFRKKSESVKITNLDHFRDLGWLSCSCEWLVDGELVKTAPLKLPKIGPRETEEVLLRGAPKNRGNRCLALLKFHTRKDCTWAPAGHLVAWQPVEISSGKKKVEKKGSGKLQLIASGEADGKGDLNQSYCAGNWCFESQPKTGFSQLNHQGEALFASPPVLQVWRAPTDNDGIKLWTGQENKALGRWRNWGLDRLSSRCTGVEASSKSIRWDYQASGRGDWNDFQWSLKLSVKGDGRLRWEAHIQVGEEFYDLPRVGLLFSLKPGSEDLQWLGLGPWENYPDRKAACWPALHKSTVKDQFVPYIMPQENGLKCGTTEIILGSNEGEKLEIETERPIAFSALHFDPASLTASRHLYELKESMVTYLSLDLAHRGLGTHSCGPDTLEKYRIEGHDFRLKMDWQVSK
ncbi:MAG: glycoside hydrolase family 2 TIM barrel-domain containing protein [Puniceicoccaceae bacterium]